MFANRSGNLRANETHLVSADVALYNTAGGGNHINNTATGAVRLADHQIGVFAADGRGTVAMNVALDTTPTSAEANAIFLAQGTSYSSNPAQMPGARYPLWNEPYVRSADIFGRNGVYVTKQVYAAPAFSTWVVGAAAGDPGAITALDNTEYTLGIAYQGVRHHMFYNPDALHHFDPAYVTPDYTTLGTAEPVDHLLQNLTFNINRNSAGLTLPINRKQGQEPVIALLIDSTGSDGVVINTITAGDTIPVMNSSNGVRNWVITADQLATLRAAAVAAFGDVIANVTWSILTIDTTTAGTVTGGVADLFMVMALDMPLAYVDYIPQVKVRLNLGLKSGFVGTEYMNEEVQMFEGEGSGRVLDLMWKATHGQRKYTLRSTEDPIIEFPSPYTTTTNYVVYNMLSENAQALDITNQVGIPARTIVAIPTGSGTITTFDAFMNAWLASVGSPAIKVNGI